MPKALFLYSEIAGYVVSCLSALRRKGVEVILIRWPVNPEAPFHFDLSDAVDRDIEKPSFTGAQDLWDFVEKEKPDIVYISGWIDKEYLSVAKRLEKRIPVVLGMDTPWQGTMRQIAGSIYARLKIKPLFSHAFVAGDPQKKFAKKLGFGSDSIRTGLYCADVSIFKQWYSQFPSKPNRFLYVGRYIHQKGIDVLFDAYRLYREAMKDDAWELWCAGTGTLYESRPEIEGLQHFGFVQPTDLHELIAHTSVFVLPSLYEPWGVVAQEYAVAGYPVLCSNAVMASTKYVEQGENGYTFTAGDSSSLARLMIEISKKRKEELNDMRIKSHQLGMSHTPDKWADTLIEMMNVRN